MSARTLFVRGYNFFVLVHHTESYDDEGHKVVETFPLQHTPSEKEPNFKLSEEDSRLYKNDQGFSPPKEWEEPLPTLPGDVPQQSTMDPAKIKLCQQVHDLQVEVLNAMGVDACREYQQSKVDYIIEAVQTQRCGLSIM